MVNTLRCGKYIWSIFLWVLVIKGRAWQFGPVKSVVGEKGAVVGALLGFSIAMGPVLPVSGVDDQCTSKTSAISGATIDSCRRVGLVKGRLRGCGASENCLSTAATAAGKYTAPWLARSELTAEETWTTLEAAVQSTGLKILQDKPVEGSSSDRYMLAAEKGDSRERQPAGSSLFYEFVLRASDSLVLQRAFVDKTVFLYPLQQPVSDFGALKSRLDDIQTKGGLFRTQTELERM